MQSSAFATIKTTYELNIQNESLDKISEEVLDVSICYSSLAEDDVRNTMESMTDDELQLKNIETEESVKKHAEKMFNEFDWLVTFVTEYEHFLEKDWKEKLYNAIKDEFISQMIQKWEWEKKWVQIEVVSTCGRAKIGSSAISLGMHVPQSKYF